MRFAEAEQRYRELEGQLIRGELKEDEYVTQVGHLRVVDGGGRRWMLSSRTGRWLVHDGQQWVFAEPPPDEVAEPALGAPRMEPIEEKAKAEPAGEKVKPQPAKDKVKPERPKKKTRAAKAKEAAPTVTVPSAAPRTQPYIPSGPRTFGSRLLAGGFVTLMLIGCVLVGGVSAWVFFLRDWGEITPEPTRPTAVGLVVTFTPRPATPTYTPTSTPTPSRTSTPTITPIPSDTPIPTDTPLVTDTPLPANTSTPTWTALAPPTTGQPTASGPQPTAIAAVSAPPPPSGQTYTVQEGDTLFDIALRFGVSLEALAKANGISDPTLIRPGQELVIPVPGTTPQTPTLTPTPTWTPIVLSTSRPPITSTSQAAIAPTTATANPTATPTPTPTATASGPTATHEPTRTPKPVPTSTPKPASLSGKIAFSMWNPVIQKYELYVSRIDGSGRNLLGAGFRQPQFRQDGNLLAVNGEGAPNFEHLVIMNSSGGDVREISTHSEDSYPSWSPDSTIVAFSSDSWGDGRTRLGIVHDMLAKQQDWIHIETTEIQGDYPFWMADGRVVYHGCDFLGGVGACGLYWVGAGGGTYHRLTTEQNDTAPAGSQGRVAFMSDRNGNWEVYVVNMDGGGLKRLTDNAAADGLPTWSPDGKSIAFVSNRGGTWAIWVMNANGSNQRKLFDLGGGYASGDGWTTERISWAP
jgi:LysM repeat protein